MALGPGAGPGRGERAQTHRVGSAGGPAVSLQLREAMGRFAARLVGSLFGLGLLLCGLGSLASAEPRAPPDRIGRCGGDTEARRCLVRCSRGLVEIGVPRTGPCALECGAVPLEACASQGLGIHAVPAWEALGSRSWTLSGARL